MRRPGGEARVSDFESAVRIAGARETGARCPVCQIALESGDPVVVCPACGAAHPGTCWSVQNRCASYECAPGRQELAPTAVPAFRITTEEIASARPLATRAFLGSRASPGLPRAPSQPRTNRLAVAAFITALAGIPLFGVVTGLVAVVLGALALGSIRGGNQRGVGWAAAGLLLGLVDATGWLVFLILALSGGAPNIHMQDFEPDPSTFNNLDPAIARGMRSNVLIQGKSGFSSHLGSGVIMAIDQGSAYVLTNRHVADPDFTAEPEAVRGGRGGANLTVQLVGQSAREGVLTWVAPDKIDLAIVRVSCSTDEVQAAKWNVKPVLKVGDPVFAIGNPQGLGWTHTQGTISQFRIKEAGAYKLRVIQMQTAVNPGNSGGGLYDQKGELVGIVTWSQDKRISEGLNFAIALESVMPLITKQLAGLNGAKD